MAPPYNVHYSETMAATSAPPLPVAKSTSTWEWRELAGRAIRHDFLSDKVNTGKHFPDMTKVHVTTQCRSGRLLVIIDNGVYDLTTFAEHHPGGAIALSHASGQDCSDLFSEYHPASTYKLLPGLQVGTLAVADQEAPSELALDRRRLRQALLAAGLYESNLWYFAAVTARSFAFFALSLVLLALAAHWPATGATGSAALDCGSNSWTHVFRASFWYCASSSIASSIWASSAGACRFWAAIAFGMFFQQLAFIGHDCGHSGITHDRKLDTLIGIFAGNLFTGISLAWWKLSHNVHHIVCNSIEHDPDIQHLPVIACSTSILHSGAKQKQVCPCESCAPLLVASALERAGAVTVAELRKHKTTVPTTVLRSISQSSAVDLQRAQADIPVGTPGFWGWQPLFYSTFHRKWFGLNGLTRAVLSLQHFLFYPLMAVARFNLYAQSWILLITRKDNPRLRNLELAMLTVHVLWHGTLLALTLPNGWARFQFLLISHAVAGVLHVQITLSHFAMEVYHGTRLEKFEDWCTTQVRTTMNIDTSGLTDWFHGGLQCQIEHHMFPRIPRHNLRAVSRYVQPFCAKHGIEYISVPFLRGNYMVFQSLKRAAQLAWDSPAPTAQDSMLVEGLHARG